MAKKSTSAAQALEFESSPGAAWRDLSELLQRERELHRVLKKTLDKRKQGIERGSKRQFRMFLDSIPLSVVHVGTDQRVVFCNKSFAGFVGLPRVQTIGKRLWEVLSTDYDTFRPHLLRALENRKVAFEQSFHGAKHRYFHATITPDLASGDAVAGVFISLLDITDRKALEEKQRRNEKRFRELARERADLLKEKEKLLNAAQEAVRVKDNFMAILSHELRTPLTSILGWVKLIKSHTVTPDRFAEGITAIERNANSQRLLIEELLDLSRMASGKMQLEWSAVNLYDLVKGTVESMRPAFTEKGVQLDINVSDGMAPIRGDREKLQEVILNLLSNALKFTSPGGHVRIEGSRTAAEVQIRVQDDGQGIPEDFLPHVFDQFWQADMSTTRKKGGLGLGLSIAKQLIKLHHGSIRAESPGPGQGATFVVTLPATEPTGMTQ